MKRVSVLLVSATLFVGWGCGRYSYERRLEATVDRLKFLQKLDDNLIPPPDDGKFKDFPMYVRAPKGMSVSKEFVMAELPAGQFDLAASFVGEGRNLHVLARRKTAKKAPPKGAAPPPETAARGPFEADVVALLTSVYGAGDELATPKWVNDNKGKNKFKRLIFTASNGNVIRVYVNHKDPYDAALIWDIPAAMGKDVTLNTARELCLQSFAVGRRAQGLFAGTVQEGEGSEGGSGGSDGATSF